MFIAIGHILTQFCYHFYSHKRKWQPTPVSLPGKLHGQRSLAGYSPWGHKESVRIIKYGHPEVYVQKVSLISLEKFFK